MPWLEQASESRSENCWLFFILISSESILIDLTVRPLLISWYLTWEKRRVKNFNQFIFQNILKPPTYPGNQVWRCCLESRSDLRDWLGVPGRDSASETFLLCLHCPANCDSLERQLCLQSLSSDVIKMLSRIKYGADGNWGGQRHTEMSQIHSWKQQQQQHLHRNSRRIEKIRCWVTLIPDTPILYKFVLFNQINIFWKNR